MSVPVIDCKKCKGRGQWIDWRRQYHSCPHCGGDGYVPLNKHTERMDNKTAFLIIALIVQFILFIVFSK